MSIGLLKASFVEFFVIDIKSLCQVIVPAIVALLIAILTSWWGWWSKMTIFIFFLLRITSFWCRRVDTLQEWRAFAAICSSYIASLWVKFATIKIWICGVFMGFLDIFIDQISLKSYILKGNVLITWKSSLFLFISLSGTVNTMFFGCTALTKRSNSL